VHEFIIYFNLDGSFGQELRSYIVGCRQTPVPFHNNHIVYQVKRRFIARLRSEQQQFKGGVGIFILESQAFKLFDLL
jgi:hypothetical protein